jgi:hypothetical protein
MVTVLLVLGAVAFYFLWEDPSEKRAIFTTKEEPKYLTPYREDYFGGEARPIEPEPKIDEIPECPPNCGWFDCGNCRMRSIRDLWPELYKKMTAGKEKARGERTPRAQDSGSDVWK